MNLPISMNSSLINRALIAMKNPPVLRLLPARPLSQMERWAGLILLLITLLGSATAARAASSPPERMTYQGFLVDGSGNPLAPTIPVNYPVIFRIYGDMEAATPLLWSEQQVVTVDKGSFSVILGEGAVVTSEDRPALSTIFADSTASQRYLGITVTIGANTLTLSPRLRLLPAPYSFLASQAVQLVNPSTGVPFINLAGGTVEVAGTINATGGLVGLTSGQIPSLLTGPRSFSGSVLFSNPVGITGGNTLEFGVGSNPKEANNGKIGYQTFSSGLDIVGAGANSPSRRLTFHAQGGSSFIGNVGVGEYNPSPGHTLEVLGGNEVAWFRSSGANAYLRVSDNTGFNNRVEFASRGNGRAAIWSGNDHFNVLQNGRVGIGTVSPPYLLSLSTPDINQARIRIDSPNGYVETGRWVNYYYIQLNNSVHNAGNRAATYDGDSNWDFSSDRKLKKDIVDVEPMLERALKVQVRRYRWKDDASESTHKLGVIAQEVQPLFPEMVSEIESPDGDHEKSLSVGYGDFGVIAIKAIQELNKIVESKDARITALESELAALKKQVAANADGNAQWETRFAALEKLVAASLAPASDSSTAKAVAAR